MAGLTLGAQGGLAGSAEGLGLKAGRQGARTAASPLPAPPRTAAPWAERSGAAYL